MTGLPRQCAHWLAMTGEVEMVEIAAACCASLAMTGEVGIPTKKDPMIAAEAIPGVRCNEK